MKATRSAFLAVMATAAIVVVPVGSAQARVSEATARVLATSDLCAAPTSTGKSYGKVRFEEQVLAPAAPGVAGTFEVVASAKLHGLAPGTYTADVVRLFVDSNGAIGGCEWVPLFSETVKVRHASRLTVLSQFSYGVETPTQVVALRLVNDATGQVYISEPVTLAVS